MGNNTSEKVHLRFPTLEIFAMRASRAFSTHESQLTPDEKKAAKDVFGEAIDLDIVRILISPVVSTPVTLGNHIRTKTYPIPRQILIHELAHVWQFQTKGMGYVSDSAFHQAKAAFVTGSRGGAYNPQIVPGKSIHKYTAEEQAVIIEHYFAYAPTRQHPEYQRMIEEVRQSRPLPRFSRGNLILEEAAFGPGQMTTRLLPDERAFKLRDTPGVPLLRIEF